jgi:hypothetical protein
MSRYARLQVGLTSMAVHRREPGCIKSSSIFLFPLFLVLVSMTMPCLDLGLNVYDD